MEGCHHFYHMMCGFREDSNSFLICQRSRPLAAMFLRDQVCFICFVVGHRGNIPANFYSVLTIGSRGYVNISYKCLQRKPATPCVIFLQKCTMTAAILNCKVANCFHVKPAHCSHTTTANWVSSLIPVLG